MLKIWRICHLFFAYFEFFSDIERVQFPVGKENDDKPELSVEHGGAAGEGPALHPPGQAAAADAALFNNNRGAKYLKELLLGE